MKGDGVAVVFTTSGADSHWLAPKRELARKNRIRVEEANAALALAGIAEPNILYLGYPDGYLLRYLKELAQDIHDMILRVRPDRIYVHSIEGGHFDHDFTSYVVQKVCRLLHFTNIYEWAEYNRQQPLEPPGTSDIRFPDHHPFDHHPPERIHIHPHEREIKTSMLAAHRSQNVTGLFQQGEIIRLAIPDQLEQKIYHFSSLSPSRLKALLVEFDSFIQSGGVPSATRIRSSTADPY
jgi:LmbE family N-acetylglucosaminyl deacetylase